MQERQMKIIPGAPLAAIYTRKSRATEKGESIEHQISKCIALCDEKGWGYVIYVDYDYSGETTSRPDFENMMRKVRKGEFNCVVVYHIYRFARNMKDVVVIVDELNSMEVGFISISQKEFDTTTIMGRAGFFMTALFGQIEREDRAIEVKDNMIFLASIGRWNGGPVPFGFIKKVRIEDYRGDLGHKEISYLVINDEESEDIEKFYDWYLESGGSIRNNVIRANEKGYLTKKGFNWNHNQMSRILQNPIYCIADQDAYNYFKNYTDVNIIDKSINPKLWDGTHGVMVYNRRRPYKNTTRENPQSEWIMSVGEHKGFISGKKFVAIQNKLNKNKSEAPRTGQSSRTSLVSLVRCACCGSAMSIFASPRYNDKSKGYYHYFRCITREQKAKILCANTNVRADILEDLVLSHIIGLVNNESALKSILGSQNNDYEDMSKALITKKNKLQKVISDLDSEINNLVDALSKNILPELVIKRKYKDLENKKVEIRNEIEKINMELNNNYVEELDLEIIKKHLKNFKYTYDHLNIEEKKLLMSSIVKEILIDRNKVKLTLYFLPGQEYDLQADCYRKDKDSWKQ